MCHAVACHRHRRRAPRRQFVHLPHPSHWVRPDKDHIPLVVAAWEVTARQLAPKGRVYLGVSARPVLTPDYFPPVVDIDIVNPALIGCHHYRLPAYHSTDGSVVLNPDGVPQAVDGGGGVIQLVAR